MENNLKETLIKRFTKSELVDKYLEVKKELKANELIKSRYEAQKQQIKELQVDIAKLKGRPIPNVDSLNKTIDELQKFVAGQKEVIRLTSNKINEMVALFGDTMQGTKAFLNLAENNFKAMMDDLDRSLPKKK